MPEDDAARPTRAPESNATDRGPAAAAPPATPPAPVDRRGFVRAIASDGVTAAGMLAGISGSLVGSLTAAAKAAGETLGTLGVPSSAAKAPGGSPASPAVPRPSALPPLPAPASGPAAPATPPVLSDTDRAVLDALTLGLLATNQAGGAPAVGIVRFRFDGAVFRIPGRSATARTGNLQRDPFAALTLIDPATGDALLAAGRTRILYGTDGHDGAADVLAACDVPLPDGWDASDSRGEPVLIVLELQRLFRRRAADERP